MDLSGVGWEVLFPLMVMPAAYLVAIVYLSNCADWSVRQWFADLGEWVLHGRVKLQQKTLGQRDDSSVKWHGSPKGVTAPWLTAGWVDPSRSEWKTESPIAAAHCSDCANLTVRTRLITSEYGEARYAA